MVAIVAGRDTGLFAGSAVPQIGAGQQSGVQGQGGDNVAVNVANGNLVLQRRDELLIGRGMDASLLRTYNSQARFSDDNGDAWWLSGYRRLQNLSGNLNSAGSQIERVSADGSVQRFSFIGNGYRSTDGDGAHDTLRYDAGSNSWTYTDGNTQSTESYAAFGSGYRLVSSSDSNGNRVSFSYNNDLLSRVSTANGDAIEFSYTGRNLTSERVIKAGGGSSTRTLYSYDEYNRLKQVTVDLSPDDNSTADGKVYQTTYRYDGSSNRLAGIDQTDGSKLSFTYLQVNGEYRLETVTDGLNRVTRFAYDTSTRTTTVFDAYNYATRYSYDTEGRLLSVSAPSTAAGVQSVTFQYDGDGNLFRSVDGQNNAVVYTYDAAGNQISQQDDLGNRIERTYGSANQLLTETTFVTPDPDGAGAATASQPLTSRYAYDSRLNLRYTLSAEGRVTEYRYNSLGQRISQISYLGNRYPVSALAKEASLSEAQLDAWVAGQNKAQTTREDFVYNLQGLLDTRTRYSQVDANGSGIPTGASQTRQVYDTAGRLLFSYDGNNNQTSYSYDGLGRLLSTTDAYSKSTVHTYDDAGRRITHLYANGRLDTQTYDLGGQLTSQLAGGVQPTQYAYDAAGRLAYTQDADGNRVYQLYDEANRLVGELHGGTRALTEHIYNARGEKVRTVRYATPVSQTALATLVVNGQPANPTLASLRPAADNAHDLSGWFFYDKAGRLTKAVDALGYVTETRYDGAGRVVAEVRYATPLATQPTASSRAEDIQPATANSRTSRRFYDGDGKLTGSLDAAGYLTTIEYDNAGRAWHSTRFATAVNPSLMATGTLAQLLPTADASNDQHSYTLYDAQNRVVASLDAERYLSEVRYDAAGNKLSETRYASRVGSGISVSVSSTVDNLRPAASPLDNSQSFTYTKLNQIDTSTATDGTVNRFGYNEIGLRTSASLGDGVPAENRRSLTRYNALGQVIAELSGEGAALALASSDATAIEAIWAKYGTRYQYDAAGRRTAALSQNPDDGSSLRTLFYYDTAGRLLYTINPLGEASGVAYNTLGQVSDSRKLATRIPAATLATLQGGLTHSGIDTLLSNLFSAVDAGEHYEYNVRGERVLTQTGVGGRSEVDFNAFGEVQQTRVLQSDNRKRVTTFSYDARGLLRDSVVDGTQSQLTHTDYDAFGRAIKVTSPGQVVQQQSYDRLGRIITVSGAQISSATFDAFGRVLTQTDAYGRTTTTAYDDKRRTVTVTTPEGIKTVTEKNRFGETFKLTDGEGHVSEYAYDRNGRLLSTKRPVSSEEYQETTQRYDAAGRLTETVLRSYRKVGNAFQVIDARGVVNRFEYDAVGRVLVSRTDPDGVNLATRYEFDGMGRTVKTTNAAGNVTVTEFDGASRVKATVVDPKTPTNPNGLNLRTEYSYDPQGNVLTVIEGAGSAQPKTTQYVYDVQGRRSQEIVDPAGLKLTTTYGYDSDNRVISRADGEGRTTRYAYDNRGRQVLEVNELGETTETVYDANSRVIEKRQYATRNPNPAALPAQIKNSQLRELRNEALDRRQRFIYDKDGRNTFEIAPDGQITERIFDKRGLVLSERRYASGVFADVPAIRDAGGTLTTIGGSDYANQLYSRLLKRSPDAASFANAMQALRTYAGLNLGWLQGPSQAQGMLDSPEFQNLWASQNPPINGAANNRNFVAWAYRTLLGREPDTGGLDWWAGQLGTADTSKRGVIVWEFLRSGEAIDNAIDNATQREWNFLRDYRDDSKDQVSTYDYDSIGRLRSQTVNGVLSATHRYDAAGNLASVTDAQGNLTQYQYDAAGRKTREIDAKGQVTDFIYDGAGRLKESRKWTLQALAWSGGLLRREPDGSATFYGPEGERIRLTADTPQFEIARRSRAIAKAWETAYGYKIGYATLAAPKAAQHATDLANFWLGTKPGDNWVWAQGKLIRNQDDSATYFDPQGQSFRLSASMSVQEVASLSPYIAQQWQADFGLQLATTASVLATGDSARMASEYQNYFTQPVHDASQDRVTQYEYDAAGRLKTLTHADGKTEVYTYDAVSRKTLMTNTRGHNTSYVYDGAGRLAYELAPAVAQTATPESSATTASLVTRFVYDKAGNLTERWENDFGAADQKRVTKFFYNRAGRQVALEQAAFAGAQPVYNLGDDGRFNQASLDLAALSSLRTPRSETAYDAFGNAVAYLDVGGQWSCKSYDAAGRIRFEVDALGQVTEHRYDLLGNQRELIRYGGKISVTPNATGYTTAELAAKVAGLDQSDKRVLSYEYDRFGRQTKITEPTAFQLNQSGMAEAGQAARETRQIYNGLGQLVKQSVTLDAGQTADSYFYYDALGRKIGQVDAGGFLTTWAYDEFGNSVVDSQYSIALRAGSYSTSSNLMDLVEQVAGKTDAGSNGVRVHRAEYDKLNRLVTDIQVNVAGGYGAARGDVIVRSQYDAAGNPIVQIDARGNASYLYYDAMGRLSLELRASGDMGDQLRYTAISHEYNAFGNETRTVRYGNTVARNQLTATPETMTVDAVRGLVAGSGQDRTELRRYDAAGHLIEYRLDAVNIQGGGQRQYWLYDNFGRNVLEWTASQNVDGSQNNSVRSFSYDAAGRQTATVERLGTIGQATRLVTTAAEYNAYGDITRRAINGDTQSLYRYDSAGRVWARFEGGVWSASFYNRAGQETARLFSPVEGAIQSAGSAEALARSALVDGNNRRITAPNSSWRRTYTDYNALGQVTRQIDPGFNTRVGGLGYAPNVAAGTAQAEAPFTVEPHIEMIWGENIRGRWVEYPEPIERQVGNDITFSPRWVSVADTAGLDGNLTVEVSYTLNGVARTAIETVTRNETTANLSVYDRAQSVLVAVTGVKVYGTVNGVRQILRDSSQPAVATLNLPRNNADTSANWVRVRQPDGSWQVFAPTAADDGTTSRLQIDRLLAGTNGPRDVEIVSLMPGFALTAGMDNAALVKHAVGYARFSLSRDGGGNRLTLLADGLTVSAAPEHLLQQDRWGNKISLSDSQGNTSRWLYNRFNQQTHSFGATVGRMDETGKQRQAVLVSQSRYDNYGALVEQLDGEGHQTVFDYDRLGRNTAQWHRITDQSSLSDRDRAALISRAGSSGLYSLDSRRLYDFFGRLGYEQVDSAVAGSEYSYNAADQLIQIRRSGQVWQLGTGATNQSFTAKSVMEVTDYRYDGRGQRILESRYRNDLTTSHLHTRQDYDSLGHVVATQQYETLNFQPTSRGTRHVSGYDVYGNKVFEKNVWWNAQGQETPSDMKYWTYAATGRLLDHTDLGNNVTRYNYDGTGQLTSQTITLGGGNSAINEATNETYNTGVVTRSFAYDEAGHLTGTSQSRDANVLVRWQDDAPLFETRHAELGAAQRRYDSEGRLVFERFDRDTTHWVQTTAYDNAGRIDHVAATGVAISYFYDGAGNRRAILGASSIGNGDSWEGYANWYRYDDRNREAVSQGVLTGTGIVVSSIRRTATMQRPEVITGSNGLPAFAQVSSERDAEHTATGYVNGASGIRYLGSGTLRSEVMGKEKRVINNVNQEVAVGDRLDYDDFGRVRAFRHNSNATADANDYAFLNQSRRQYDFVGRVGVEETFKDGGAFDQRRLNGYDADGRLIMQEAFDKQIIYNNRNRWRNGEPIEVDDEVPPTTTVYKPISKVSYNYNGEVLQSYSVLDNRANQTTTYGFQYAGFESWKEVVQTANGPTGSGQTTTTLDDFGNALRIVDQRNTSSNRKMVYDLDGRLLDKRRDYYYWGQRFAYAGSSVIGSTMGMESGQGADFDYNYTALSAKSLPTTTQSNYTVNNGDTLQKIALAVWGDGNLWYLIADANGIKASDALTPGQTLKIPSTVTAANRSDTFKPYNAQKLIGETTPELPPPPPPPQPGRGGCGGIAQIVMIVVAVVVTVYTAGAAASALGAATTSATATVGGTVVGAGVTAGATAASVGTLATGAAALGGTFGAAGLAAAAIGGAVGSLASQMVGVAFGVQDSISWKGVATSALSAGITAGIGGSGLGEAIKGLGYGKAATSALTAAASSTISQGILSAAGLGSFSWRNVAAAAIAAPITNAISNAINESAFAANHSFMAGVATNFASGFVNQAAQIAVNGGGKLDMRQIATSAFGDAIGNELVSVLQTGTYSEVTGDTASSETTSPQVAPQLSISEEEALSAAGLQETYLTTASSEYGMKNALYEPNGSFGFQTVALDKLAGKFGLLDETSLYTAIDRMADGFIANSSSMQTLRMRRQVYDETPEALKPLVTAGGLLHGAGEGVADLVIGTAQGVGNLAKFAYNQQKAEAVFMLGLAGDLVKGDVAGARERIYQRVERESERLGAISETLTNLANFAEVLADKRAAGSLLKVAKAYWDTAAPPDKAHALGMIVANVGAAIVTGGEATGAKIASAIATAGDIGNFLPTSTGTAKAAKSVGKYTDDMLAGMFALSHELMATKRFNSVVKAARESGLSTEDIAAFANTNVMKALAKGPARERAGALSAILRAENQGMKFMDVVLQNNSGHGVDLLFRTANGMAVVEAKGGATTLSALSKDTNGLRQGGHDYNIDRLKKFVDAFKGDPNRATDVKAAQDALRLAKTNSLDSYAYLGGNDALHKLNFNGKASTPNMNALPSPAWIKHGTKV